MAISPTLPPLPSFLAAPLPPRTPTITRSKPARLGRPKGSRNKPKEPNKTAPVSGAPFSQSAEGTIGEQLQRPVGPSSSLLTGEAPTLSPLASPIGGEGVNQDCNAGDLDKSTPRVEILQSSESAVAVGEAGVDSGSSTAPLREVEGKEPSSQAGNNDGVKEGVIGVKCRNKWYVEVNVEGVWGKCAKGGMNLCNAEKVRVRQVWSSADGVDKEWEVVERLDVPEVYAGLLVKPIGYIGGSAGEAMKVGVKVEEEVQPYVPYVHEEKAEGNGDEFLARAREEATKWAIERVEGVR